MLVAAAACGLFALYLCQSRTAPFNSDGAANVLQGQAIISANPLLRGWWTSDVSFYTTELPEYALVTAIRGLCPDVVHLCGALTYTLTVLLAALVARGGAGGRAGWCRAGIAAGIMLAPSILGGTEVFLENPDHAGTAVPVLLVLLLLRRDGPGATRWDGWLVPAGACALLTLGLIGDELTLAAATAPLAVVSALRLTAGRRGRGRLASGGARRRAPIARAPIASAPIDGALLAAAVVSVGLARLADLLIRAAGGFDRRPLGGVTLAPLAAVPGNADVLWRSLLLLFGANNPGAPHTAQTIKAHVLLVSMADLHVIGLLLGGAGLAAGTAAVLFRRADRVTQLLVAAIIAIAAAGVFTTVLRSLSNAHEVAILLPLAAALAGRLVPEARRRPLPSAGRRAACGPGAGLAALALGAWLAVCLAELCYAAAWPRTQPAQQAVADWLSGHGQREGLAGYWQADATTVTSGGRVLVAPITLSAQGGTGAVRPAADRWESSAAWYQPGRRSATFVVAVTGLGAPAGLSPAAVRGRFGRPVAEHRVGQDLIMLYRYNLLTRLTATAFPGPG